MTRILYITATRLGDAVLSTGHLAHLSHAYPNASFTIACGPVAAGLFTRFPKLDRVIVVDKKRYDLHWLSLWWQVVWTKWDLVVDLRGSALSLFVPARHRAIMRGGRRAGHRLGHIAGVLDLATPPMPVVWTAPADRARANILLPPGEPFVGLGPTANWPAKMWPAERFVALAAGLAGRLPGVRFAVFGGPGVAERAAAARVIAELSGAVDLVGMLTLPQAAACLERCVLFVGNDSGLMHLAAASGTPTLGLFGPTPASEYAPAGRIASAVLADGEPGRSGMERLPVEAALWAAFDLLERDGRLAPPVPV